MEHIGWEVENTGPQEEKDTQGSDRFPRTPSMSNPPETIVGATPQAGLTVPMVVKPTEPNNGGVLSNPIGSGWDVWKEKENQSLIGADWISMPLQPLNHQTNSILPMQALHRKGYNYRKTRL
jgi:hypothetical protein